MCLPALLPVIGSPRLCSAPERCWLLVLENSWQQGFRCPLVSRASHPLIRPRPATRTAPAGQHALPVRQERGGHQGRCGAAAHAAAAGHRRAHRAAAAPQRALRRQVGCSRASVGIQPAPNPTDPCKPPRLNRASPAQRFQPPLAIASAPPPTHPHHTQVWPAVRHPEDGGGACRGGCCGGGRRRARPRRRRRRRLLLPFKRRAQGGGAGAAGGCPAVLVSWQSHAVPCRAVMRWAVLCRAVPCRAGACRRHSPRLSRVRMPGGIPLPAPSPTNQN